MDPTAQNPNDPKIPPPSAGVVPQVVEPPPSPIAAQASPTTTPAYALTQEDLPDPLPQEAPLDTLGDSGIRMGSDAPGEQVVAPQVPVAPPPPPPMPKVAPVAPAPPPPPPPTSGTFDLPKAAPVQPVPVVKTGGGSPKIFYILIPLLLIGIAVGGGYMFMQRQSALAAKVVPTAAPTKPVAVPLSLLVESPVQGSVSTTSEVAVKGKTSPNTVVAIYTNTQATTTKSDQAGSYSASISLATGINDVTVTAVDAEGKEKEEKRVVVYEE